MVTDYDVWANSPVSSKEVIELLSKNNEKTRKIIAEMISTIPARSINYANCADALTGAGRDEQSSSVTLGFFNPSGRITSPSIILR